MLALLNPAVRSQVTALGESFHAAAPFRFTVMDGFFDERFCERLSAEFPAFDVSRAKNEMGEAGRKATVPDIAKIGPAFQELDRLLRSGGFLNLLKSVTSIPGLLYDPDYVGGGTHENLDGQDLDMHVDFNYHPSRPWRRRLNLIVFLNREWEPGWGGCLTLHKDPWDLNETQSATVIPLMNRAVLFETTETSWHGFGPIRLPPERKELSRRSVAVYYYTRERPPRETAPSHGTVYVARPLPPHLAAGYTLQEEDMRELKDLLTRRDGQIKFLYERELEMSRTIGGITASPSFRIGRALTWPLRALRGRKT